MLSAGSANGRDHVRACCPTRSRASSDIATKITRRTLDDLQPGRFGIVLGRWLAQRLGVGIGDKVTVLVRRPTSRRPARCRG